MRFDVHHHIELSPEIRRRLDSMSLKLDHILERTILMATQAQLDKLKTDVAALIDAGVAEITAAIAAAQRVPPAQADAAIDDLDAKVTAATKSLTDAAAALALPPAAPTA